MNNHDTTTPRPFGYWLTAVDRLLRAEFATAFQAEGITRRDWRMLNRIDGTHPDPADRHLHERRLHRLIELDWVERDGAGWAPTAAGRLAKQRLETVVDDIRSRIAGALSTEEYEVMTASLEKVARELGWEEGRRLPRREPRRGRGRRDVRHARGNDPRRGIGPDAEHGFAHGRGLGREHGRGFGAGHHGAGHHGAGHHGAGHHGAGHHGAGHHGAGHHGAGHSAPATHIHIHHHH
ncbi:hypothetical protein ACFWHT_10520 [Microbacterium sp. NPDC058342]|uniref:hypothetical protein n=1 Tax=Microbacterium sp. NPDC058342 TaxID=3346454 RepID=UPI003648171E